MLLRHKEAFTIKIFCSNYDVKLKIGTETYVAALEPIPTYLTFKACYSLPNCYLCLKSESLIIYVIGLKALIQSQRLKNEYLSRDFV